MTVIVEEYSGEGTVLITEVAPDGTGAVFAEILHDDETTQVVQVIHNDTVVMFATIATNGVEVGRAGVVNFTGPVVATLENDGSVTVDLWTGVDDPDAFPITQNLGLYQGDDRDFWVTWQVAGEPIANPGDWDLSGAVAVDRQTAPIGSLEVVWEDMDNAVLRVRFPHTLTAVLPLGTNSCVYDVQATSNSTNDVLTIVTGDCDVQGDVTP
jgi:hypothetical protein